MPPQLRSSAADSGDIPSGLTSLNIGVASSTPRQWPPRLFLRSLSAVGRHNGSLSKKKLVLLLFTVLVGVAVTLFASFYCIHRGFRRTVQFWTNAAPLIIEYHILKFRYSTRSIKNDNSETQHEWERIRQDFHVAKAPRVVDMVQEMGGIYVKFGQALSTMGSGIIPEEYVQAMRPLQDGIPPRDYDVIAGIIESSTGRKMEDMFENFEEKPIGAATIGQAHRARLKLPPGATTRTGGQQLHQQQVIVKVQYPEVAELFDADLSNLEWLTWLLMPQKSKGLLKNARERHERELDFREEAAHLVECAHNMQKHGLEPTRVRIPRVLNETGLCTKHVLVMEYLQGVSLRDVMNEEQDRIAQALGKSNGEELRYLIAERIKEHLEHGGGGNQQGETQMKLVGGVTQGARIWNLLGPFAIHGLRRYARLREKGILVASKLRKVAPGGTSLPNHSSKTRHINLGKVLKTVLHAHALQIMVDGVFNLDAHPGNVLVLEDGRVGLLDYGMVGRLSDQERLNVASTVLGLTRNNKQDVAQLYLEAGYHVDFNGELITDPQVLFRLASTHLNKIDLSPITLSESGSFKHDSKQIGIQQLFKDMDVIHVPDWIVSVRRVGRLMMGVSAQAARPISLANEWEPVAKQALREAQRDGTHNHTLHNMGRPR